MEYEGQEGFWKKVREELQPILRHTIVVSAILLVFFLLALVFKGIQKYLPEHSEHLKWLELMDVVLIYGLILLFGLYVIAEVLIRSISGIVELSRQRFGRKEGVRPISKSVKGKPPMTEPDVGASNENLVEPTFVPIDGEVQGD